MTTQTTVPDMQQAAKLGVVDEIDAPPKGSLFQAHADGKAAKASFDGDGEDAGEGNEPTGGEAPAYSNDARIRDASWVRPMNIKPRDDAPFHGATRVALGGLTVTLIKVNDKTRKLDVGQGGNAHDYEVYAAPGRNPRQPNLDAMKQLGPIGKAYFSDTLPDGQKGTPRIRFYDGHDEVDVFPAKEKFTYTDGRESDDFYSMRRVNRRIVNRANQQTRERRGLAQSQGQAPKQDAGVEAERQAIKELFAKGEITAQQLRDALAKLHAGGPAPAKQQGPAEQDIPF